MFFQCLQPKLSLLLLSFARALALLGSVVVTACRPGIRPGRHRGWNGCPHRIGIKTADYFGFCRRFARFDGDTVADFGFEDRISLTGDASLDDLVVTDAGLEWNGGTLALDDFDHSLLIQHDLILIGG